ncbi:GNAT family N-acetyltransferase [Leifsonia sp. C5G2]|nr:GNAT family N-acetyltransferase [Leifsonia sp. C5G2]
MAGRPALWHSWPGDDRHDVEGQLVRRGFRFVEEEPLMVLEIASTPAGPAAPPGITLHEVDDDTGLRTWVRVWSGAAPDPAVVSALATAGLGDGRRVHHLVAVLDGRAVGCSAAVLAGDAVAVEHVVTEPSHRGRGIGSALTAAAVEAGRAAGARRAVLTASPDGAGLYRRLGFEEQGTVRRFAAPGAEHV